MTAADGPRDRGETLIELLVAVSIMGIALVVLIGGLGTSIRVSDIHRKQAIANGGVRAFAESVERAIGATPTAYVACADPDTYRIAAAYTPDPNFAATVLAVRYWDGTAFATTCTVATDSGVQLVVLEVRSGDDSAVERLDVVVRKPCRPQEPACA